MPQNYFDFGTVAELKKLRERACRLRDPGMLVEFDTLVGGVSLGDPWFHGARQIYANWLSHLADSQLRRVLHCEFPTVRTGPVHLAA
jgi:hypothetical protein